MPHFDDLLLLGASVSRYPLEGYRERCDTDVRLGTWPAGAAVRAEDPGHDRRDELRRAVGARQGGTRRRGATEVGTSTTTGDGGMTPEEREHSAILVYQLLPPATA